MCSASFKEAFELTGVILAGGKGSRLSSVVSDRPKVLAEIRGRPFLTYLFDQLISAGLKNVVLCTGYMADYVYRMIGESYNAMKVIYSKESEPLGTAGALRNALAHLNTKVVLVMNGDSFVQTDLIGYIKWFHNGDKNAALLLSRVSDTKRYGKVVVAEDESVTSFEEKKDNTGDGLINAGVYLMKRDLIKLIPPRTFYSLERDFFPGLIGKGIFGYQSKGSFIDIGTPESYRLAQELFTD